MKENNASIRVMQKIGMEFSKFAPYETGSKETIWYWCDQQLITKNKHC